MLRSLLDEMDLIVKTYKITDLPEIDQITKVYLKPKFLALLIKYFNLDVKYLVVKNLHTQDMVAVTVSVEKKILGIASLINPHQLYYQPIQIFSAIRKCPNENQLQNIEIYKKISEYFHRFYFRVEKNLSPDNDDIRGFLWSGISAKPLYTYRFNLKSYTSDNYFNRQRGGLRKAQKMNYSFSRVPDIDSFLRLFEGTKQRQDWNYKMDETIFHKYLNELLELGFIEQFSILNQNNEVISTMFCIMDKDNKIFYGWITSTLTSELTNGVSTLLIHSICEHLKKDYDIFDLCGANTDSIARFKASLGAELKVFYRIQL